MKTIKLVCAECGCEFDKELKEYNRRIKNGATKFYCCLRCLPKRSKIITETCLYCGAEFETSTAETKRKKCCSVKCATDYARSCQTQESVEKKRQATIDNWANGVYDERIYSKENYQKVYPQKYLRIERHAHKTKQCEYCGEDFVTRRNESRFCSCKCSAMSRRDKTNSLRSYRRRCSFDFALNQYPDEFDFNLIRQYGWYKPKNRGDNLTGVSRDHMVSVRWGYDNNIDPEILKHPANCKLVRHGDNVSKGTSNSITYEELLQRIEKWNRIYGTQANQVKASG